MINQQPLNPISRFMTSLPSGAVTSPCQKITALDKTRRVIDCARDHIADWMENEGKDDPDCYQANEALVQVSPLLLSAPAMMRLLTQVVIESRDGHAKLQTIDAIRHLLMDPSLNAMTQEICQQHPGGLMHLLADTTGPHHATGAGSNQPVPPVLSFAPSIRPGVLYRDWIAKNDRRISAHPSEETLSRYDKFALAIIEGKSILTSKEDFERFGRLREYGNQHGFDLASVYAAFDNANDVAINGEVRDDLISADDIEKIGSVLAMDILGDYSDPEMEPDMCWLQANCSYLHRSNGQDGVWEFLLNTALEHDGVPEKFQPLLDEAKRKNLAYLLIHQGT